jgi:hypothetical protein
MEIKIIKFTPYSDITTYELAQCVGILMAGENLTMEKTEELGESIMRHFETEEFDREAWKERVKNTLGPLIEGWREELCDDQDIE